MSFQTFKCSLHSLSESSLDLTKEELKKSENAVKHILAYIINFLFIISTPILS
jgi:hypothetical protein